MIEIKENLKKEKNTMNKSLIAYSFNDVEYYEYQDIIDMIKSDPLIINIISFTFTDRKNNNSNNIVFDLIDESVA